MQLLVDSSRKVSFLRKLVAARLSMQTACDLLVIKYNRGVYLLSKQGGKKAATELRKRYTQLAHPSIVRIRTANRLLRQGATLDEVLFLTGVSPYSLLNQDYCLFEEVFSNPID